MNKQIFLIAFVALSVSACSSPGSRERVSGDYEYTKTQGLEQGFQTPDDLQQPRVSNRYSIPNLESEVQQATLIGDQIKISSPRLVLPLVAGSHVEEGSEDATVLFDQVNDNAALDRTVWDKVLAYLEQNNIGVESFDRENNVLVTDWVISTTEVDGKWYELSNEFIEQAKKFKLSLDIAPHGRTASLTNSIVAYIDENGNEALSALDPISKRTNEVDFINYIIAEYDFGVRLAQTQRIAKIREGFGSSLGFNADGESAILVDAVYNDAWPRLLLVLRKMGFDVIDLDQSSGIMFVAYNGVEEGWFSGLFAKDELLLDEDNYRLFVKRAGERTSITLKTNENETFSPKQVTDIFPVFEEYMASDNLDI
ncbi:MAG: outer membrane protein assembly factor BamC [Glaciecola sp.]